MEPGADPCEAACTQNGKQEQILCQGSAGNRETERNLQKAESGEKGAGKPAEDPAGSEKERIRKQQNRMICEIPLAQIVEKTVGRSPFRQELPRAALTARERLWDQSRELPPFLAVCDKPGLLCGKCATE